MKFDELIQSILESSSTNKPIPAFDGREEVYGISVHAPRYYRDPDSIKYTDVVRLNNYDVELLQTPDALSDYGCDVMYQGEDIEHALQKLYNCYLEYYEVSVPQEALNVIRNKLGGLVGKWMVINDSANSETISIYIIVDIALMRSKQLHKDLLDSDTTGFEDLL